MDNPLIFLLPVLNWPMIFALTAAMLFSYWLNYCMGSPLADNPDDVDPKAILFFFPKWLADRRLKQENLDAQFRKELAEQLLVTTDPKTRNGLRQDFRLETFLTGRMFFTWERSLLCPICLHWWLTVLLVILLFIFGWLTVRETLWQVGFTYLVNHFFIRKLA